MLSEERLQEIIDQFERDVVESESVGGNVDLEVRVLRALECYRVALAEIERLRAELAERAAHDVSIEQLLCAVEDYLYITVPDDIPSEIAAARKALAKAHCVARFGESEDDV